MPDSPFRQVAPQWLSLGLPPQEGVVTEVALSADGSLVAASLLTPDPAADQDRISTWIRPTDEVGTWTGPHTGCTGLSFSPGPDGPRLLGLAAADQGQVCVVIDLETGGVLRATAPMLSGGKPVWRPDGGGFAWSCAPVPEAPPTLHRSRRLGFDRDGRGWLAEDVRRVHVFALGDDKPVIVESATDCRELIWSAEGLLYVADRHDDRHRDLGAQLFRFDPGTGHEVALTGPDLVPAASARLPDGTVAFVALTDAAGCGSVGAVHTTEGRLTDPATTDVAHPLTSRVHGLSVVGELLVTAQLARGAVPLLLLDPARPGRQQRLLDGPCEVDAYDAGHGGIVALVRQGASAEDLLFLPRAALPEPVESTLPVREPVSLGERCGVRPLTVNGVDAWLVPPANGSESPAPLVVWLHGGPGAQAGWVIPPTYSAWRPAATPVSI
ncbi:hypothetical protein KEF29_32735 [Streptomyces tuirus]|uniref:Acyl-peptide hydrolase n=1 Tax=Streptomyces tuirus TaxID=68278 RepID=A0A941FFU1_9ACTN|nr:hypothetical protein [Streptomyces tuirus]